MAAADIPDPGTLATTLALLIRDGFEHYHARFAAVTQRARLRFETRDWAGARQDAVERIGLYDHCIAQTVDALRRGAGEQVGTRTLWLHVRQAYAALLDGLIDAELYKTFYNTLARRLFATQGVDAAIEFMAMDVEPSDAITHPVARHSYTLSATRPAEALLRVLGDYRFDVPYAHQLRCAAAIAVRLQDDLAHWGDYPVRSIELLDTVFYRERRAYLVGRVFGEHRFSPCVIALVNDQHGLRAEAVLTRRRDVAHLFGVSRSYSRPTWPRWAMQWCSCAACCRASPSMKSTPCWGAPSRARPSVTAPSSGTSRTIPPSSWCMPMAPRAWSWRCSRCPAIRWCSS